ncbi:alpha/beta hydrolase [Bacillus sp. TL12]|uniref:alpha/beta hydrolase n=1 Tax=Bacillus sp. TL12 TaxID=2894756 RepID=UPI001F519993|nr:alpha/beta hydrolase [Bacillus sp. TL12]MCI0765890.1 alpha/beta hydrolase [Bacillus sp. TL12]
MLITKMVERFALYDLHRKRSKNFQFSPLPSIKGEVKDIEAFYKKQLTDISFDLKSSDIKNYKTGKFKYESGIQTGYSRNDLVTGEAYINNNEAAANVIFVHGWRMDSNDRVKKIFHNQIMDLGWNMYYFTLPFHFDREPDNSLYSGEFMVSANIQRTVRSTQQAVVDLRTLINWIKTNKEGPIVLIGISLGGFITNLTSLVEPDIDVLASIFYANRISYSIWNTDPGKYIKSDLENHGVTYQELIDYWKVTEPSQALPKVKKENILLITAKYDEYVHFEDTDYLWSSWDRPTRYIYNCGHAGIVLKKKKIGTDTLNFIRNRIKVN